MLNLGFPEIFLIASVALLVFGPSRLPELAQGLGKGIRGFKKALNGELEETTSVSANNTAPQNGTPSS